MPYVNNHGVRIHYEVEGHGQPLVLLSGLTRNLKTWRLYGYVKELKGDYLLILLDARGHGESEKPHDPQAYGPEMMTADVVAVLNDLGIEHANYWGYSMGSRIGYQLTRYHPSRFSSYILGGSSPYPRRSETEKQFANHGNTMVRLGVEKGPEAVIAFLEKWRGRSYLAHEKERIRGNDYEALYAIWQRGPMVVDNDLLAQISVPCLLYAGDRDASYDGVKEAAKHIPDASFISIPSLAHSPAYERSEFILPHAMRFLLRVTG